jgi:hypothetical protein
MKFACVCIFLLGGVLFHAVARDVMSKGVVVLPGDIEWIPRDVGCVRCHITSYGAEYTTVPKSSWYNYNSWFHSSILGVCGGYGILNLGGGNIIVKCAHW